MLSRISFQQYNNLLVSEVYGSGKNKYEVLVESNIGSVVKMICCANTIRECEKLLIRRFSLYGLTRKGDSNCWTYSRGYNNLGGISFSSLICRQIVI